MADKLAGQYVELYDFSDRPLEVRWKGHLLPYRVFSKDQPVSHTAIVENKRLSHALRTVKAQQDIKHVPAVMTNSAKGGYKKRPRQLYGPNYKAESPRPQRLFMTPWRIGGPSEPACSRLAERASPFDADAGRCRSSE